MGLSASGTFWYYARNTAKNCDTFGFRSGDPGVCGDTTSTLPDDTSAAGIASNCQQSYYVDSQGSPTTSYANTLYDPRQRPWYTAAVQRRSAGWSPVYVFFDNKLLGITYTVPFSNRTSPSSPILGVLGIDYNLQDVAAMLQAIEAPDMVQYIFVAATFELIAASTGESPASADGASTRLCTAANNTMIRESATFLHNNSFTLDGPYHYLGADGQYYALQLSHWSDATGTIAWAVAVVSLDKDWVLDMSGEARHSAGCIAADLTAFTSDAVNPAQYLSFLAGLSVLAPLSAPLIDVTAPALRGLTQQTLWGSFNAFPNSFGVWIAYATKALMMYDRMSLQSYSQSYFFQSPGAGVLQGYSLGGTEGLPQLTPFTTVNPYDPTSRPWYNVANKTEAWSGFFEFSMAPGIPSIAYVSPLLNSDGSKAGVVAVSRLLSSFSDMLAPYASTTGVAFLLDASLGLVATSNTESTWVSAGLALKPAALSSSLLVREAAHFLSANQINSDNTYTMHLAATGQVAAVVCKPWSDSSKGLNWKIVVVALIDPSCPAVAAASFSSSAASSTDLQTARDASTAAAVFSSFVFVIVAVLLALKAVELGGATEVSAYGGRRGAEAEEYEDDEEVENPMARKR